MLGSNLLVLREVNVQGMIEGEERVKYIIFMKLQDFVRETGKTGMEMSNFSFIYNLACARVSFSSRPHSFVSVSVCWYMCMYKYMQTSVV